MTEYIVNADEENSLMYGRKYEELIRCKDCANYMHIDCPFEWTGGRPKPDMYCAWAERRTSCDE